MTDISTQIHPTDADAAGTDPATSPTSPGMPDPRPHFAAAVRVAGEVLAGVHPDQLDAPTPCQEFSVDELSAHLLAVLSRIGVLGNGGDFSTTPGSIDLPFADRQPAYAKFADAALQAWSSDASLDQMVTVPWGVLPGRVCLLIYVNELSVHSWDLATATGQQPNWDTDAMVVALAAIQFGLPREGRSADGTGSDGLAPFAPVVDVDAAAPLIDRLVGWNGRRP